MSIRTEELANVFAAWLRRYSPPRIMADDPETLKAERDTLLRVILKFAPADGYIEWLNRVLDRLEYQMKTRAWPTKGELGAVCSNLAKEGHGQRQQSEWSLDPVAIAAKRMNAGNPVGDDWLFGRRCVELMATGDVSVETLRQYRSAWYFSAKDVYGEDKAREMEDAMLKRHEDAEATGAAMGQSVTKIPTYKPKTFGGEGWAAE